MIGHATRHIREVLAWGLLAAVGVILVCAFALLLKDGASFSDKSAVFGYLWVHPVQVGLVVLAVALVGYADPSRRARLVAMVATGLLALMLALGLLTWVSAVTSDNGESIGFAGIAGAGKVVGTLVGLAFLVLTALATWFAVSVVRALPTGSGSAQPGVWAGQYGPAPYPPGQYAAGQHPQPQYATGQYAGQYGAGQYSPPQPAGSQYGHPQYAQSQPAAGQYAQGQYGQGQYPAAYPEYGQYSPEQYQQYYQHYQQYAQYGQPGAQPYSTPPPPQAPPSPPSGATARDPGPRDRPPEEQAGT